MVALGGLGYQLFTSRCGGVPLGLPSAGPLSEVTAPTPLTQVQEAFHQCWKQVASFPLFYLAGQVGVTYIWALILKPRIRSYLLHEGRRQWQPTPVFLPGKSHGRRSLVGCSPWGREEWDTTE